MDLGRGKPGHALGIAEGFQKCGMQGVLCCSAFWAKDLLGTQYSTLHYFCLSNWQLDSAYKRHSPQDRQ